MPDAGYLQTKEVFLAHSLGDSQYKLIQELGTLVWPLGKVEDGSTLNRVYVGAKGPTSALGREQGWVQTQVSYQSSL